MLVPTLGNLVPFLKTPSSRFYMLWLRDASLDLRWHATVQKAEILAFGTFFDFILDPSVNTKNCAMPWCWMLLSLAGQKSYCTAPHAVALWNFSDTSASKAFSGSLEEGPYIRKSESHVKTSETDFQVCISRRLGLFGKESSFLRHCHNCTL